MITTRLGSCADYIYSNLWYCKNLKLIKSKRDVITDILANKFNITYDRYGLAAPNCPISIEHNYRQYVNDLSNALLHFETYTDENGHIINIMNDYQRYNIMLIAHNPICSINYAHD